MESVHDSFLVIVLNRHLECSLNFLWILYNSHRSRSFGEKRTVFMTWKDLFAAILWRKR